MPKPDELGQIPVRVFGRENQFELAAPMAGLEPGDIRVAIEGNCVTIKGRERGPRQHNLDLLRAEWSIGPYYREIVLPENVDGSLANATFGNGVLVVTVPKGDRRPSPLERNSRSSRSVPRGANGSGIQDTLSGRQRQASTFGIT